VGYDLHIIRGERWSKSIPIPLDEWREVVAAAPDLHMMGSVEVTGVGEVVRYENPPLAEWLGHPSGDSVPFDFQDGRVVVKNPDVPTIARMIDVASALGARVQGVVAAAFD
jgi:hypothetical protein